MKYIFKKKINKIDKEKNKTNINKNDAINKLIDSVFEKEEKKNEFIKKFMPFFSLKVNPNKNLEKIYLTFEIDPKNINIVKEYNYKEEKYESKNKYETNQKSFGLIEADLNLSLNIYGYNVGISSKLKNIENKANSKIGSKFYCMNSNIVSLFRIIIDPNKIKIDEKITKDFDELKSKNETEKRRGLEMLTDKYGLYIPLALLVGGRIDYYFDGNNESEINEIHNYLQFKMKGDINISGEFNDKNKKNFHDLTEQKISNISIDVKGGNYNNNIDEWIESFNPNNLEIIGYKSLRPIYCFIEGLEPHLSLCISKKYEDIVLEQIHKLINKEFKEKEKDIYKGTSSENESWEVGLTKEIYNTFTILKKSFPINISLKENKKKYIICGEILKNFLICGWRINTNTNSKEFDVICNWERKKEIPIIGNRNFKFNIIIPENQQFIDGEIQWNVDIFCIHSNRLNVAESEYIYFQTKGHYFLNCDCYKTVRNIYNSKCIYNKDYNEISEEEYWNKVSVEELKKRLEIEKSNKEEIDKLIKKIEKEMTREYLFPEI